MDWPQPKDFSLDSPVAAGSQQPVFSRHGPGEGFFLIEEQRSGVCVLLLLKPTLVWDLGGVVAARRRMRPGTAAGQRQGTLSVWNGNHTAQRESAVAGKPLPLAEGHADACLE